MAKKKKIAKKPAAKAAPGKSTSSKLSAAPKVKAAKRPVAAKKVVKKTNPKAAKVAKVAKNPVAKTVTPKGAIPKVAAKLKKFAKNLIKEKPVVAKSKPVAPPPAEAKKIKKRPDEEAATEVVDVIVEIDTTVVEAVETASEEIVLTDAEGRRYCRVKDCDQTSVVDGYCRYHYLLYWKRIQVRKKILGEGKLERYIEELTSRYPDKYLEMLKKDLKSEKDFLAAIQELEIDESGGDGEFEDEAQNYIDEVRGMSEAGTARDDEEF
jgi:hypothetical protein